MAEDGGGGFPWGDVLAGVGAGASSSAAGAAETRERQRGKKTLHTGIKPRLAETSAAENRQLELAKKERVGGYDQALAETAGLDRIGRRRILEGQKVQREEISQDLTARGLTGSFAANALTRGLHESTLRSLEEHNARFAAARSELFSRRGEAAAMGSEKLARQYGLQINRELQSFWSPLLTLRTGQGIRYWDRSGGTSQGGDGGGGSDYGAIAGAIGALLSLFGGGDEGDGGDGGGSE